MLNKTKRKSFFEDEENGNEILLENITWDLSDKLTEKLKTMQQGNVRV